MAGSKRSGRKRKPLAYSLRVALEGGGDVWRIVQIRGDQTLEELHEAICDAFNWDMDHLWAFFMNNRYWDPQEEYGPPEVGEGAGDAAATTIDILGLEVGGEFCYIFDFGDEWRHAIEVVEIEPADDGPYPRIVETRGEAPPQYADVDEEAYEEEEDLEERDAPFDERYAEEDEEDIVF